MSTKLLLGGLALTLAAACGPIQSTVFLVEARGAIERARAADADKLAPYEMTSADSYYEKALEEQAYADFEPAVIYAKRALEQAEKAKAKAEVGADRATPPSLQPPPDQGGGLEGAPADPAEPAVRVVPDSQVDGVDAEPDDVPGGSPPPLIVPVPEDS